MSDHEDALSASIQAALHLQSPTPALAATALREVRDLLRSDRSDDMNDATLSIDCQTGSEDHQWQMLMAEWIAQELGCHHAARVESGHGDARKDVELTWWGPGEAPETASYAFQMLRLFVKQSGVSGDAWTAELQAALEQMRPSDCVHAEEESPVVRQTDEASMT